MKRTFRAVKSPTGTRTQLRRNATTMAHAAAKPQRADPQRDRLGQTPALTTIEPDISQRKSVGARLVYQVSLHTKVHNAILVTDTQLNEPAIHENNQGVKWRAPLRAIDGFSRILLEEYAPTLAPEVQRYLRIVRSNTP